MSEWTANIVNDIYNDYELMIEIWCNNENVINIKKGKKRKVGLLFMWYAHNSNLIISLEALLDLMSEAKEIHPKAKNKININASEWTADFINDPNNNNKLAIEIRHNNKELVNIKNGKDRLECIFFAHDTKLAIPFDWFFDLVVVAHKSKLSIN